MKHELTPRQNEIVDVALHLMAEGGIGNLTIRHISKRLMSDGGGAVRAFQRQAGDHPGTGVPVRGQGGRITARLGGGGGGTG